MWSRSASESRRRPSYADFALVYDSLVDAPVEPWVDAVCTELTHDGVAAAKAEIIDAGCGTGRHAAELIRRGYRVDLVDASHGLLAQAAARCSASRVFLADLCELDLPRDYDAVTCRGVLNDMITDGERDSALAGLARLLRPGGLLLLDVREAEASAARADGRERSRTVEFGSGLTLTYTNTVTWRDGLFAHRRTLRPSWARDGTAAAPVRDASLVARRIGQPTRPRSDTSRHRLGRGGAFDTRPALRGGTSLAHRENRR